MVKNTTAIDKALSWMENLKNQHPHTKNLGKLFLDDRYKNDIKNIQKYILKDSSLYSESIKQEMQNLVSQPNANTPYLTGNDASKNYYDNFYKALNIKKTLLELDQQPQTQDKPWIKDLVFIQEQNYSRLKFQFSLSKRANSCSIIDDLVKLDESVVKMLFELTGNVRSGLNYCKKSSNTAYYRGPNFEWRTIVQNLDKFSTLDKEIQLLRLEVLNKNAQDALPNPTDLRIKIPNLFSSIFIKEEVFEKFKILSKDVQQKIVENSETSIINNDFSKFTQLDTTQQIKLLNLLDAVSNYNTNNETKIKHIDCIKWFITPNTHPDTSIKIDDNQSLFNRFLDFIKKIFCIKSKSTDETQSEFTTYKTLVEKIESSENPDGDTDLLGI